MRFLKCYSTATLTLILILFSYLTTFSSGNEKPLTLKELTTNSDIIVRGKITSIKCYEKESGRIYSDISFRVSDVFKGNYTKNQTIVLTYLGGTVNGITMAAVEFPQFRKNEESILFLQKTQSANSVFIKYKITGLTEGKFDVISRNKTNYIKRNNFTGTKLIVDDVGNTINISDENVVSLSEFMHHLNLFSK